jgi:hypothetical protein
MQAPLSALYLLPLLWLLKSPKISSVHKTHTAERLYLHFLAISWAGVFYLLPLRAALDTKSIA